MAQRGLATDAAEIFSASSRLISYGGILAAIAALVVDRYSGPTDLNVAIICNATE